MLKNIKEKSDNYTKNGTEINIKNARKIFKDISSSSEINEKISARLNKEKILNKDGSKIRAVIKSEIKSGKVSEEISMKFLNLKR